MEIVALVLVGYLQDERLIGGFVGPFLFIHKFKSLEWPRVCFFFYCFVYSFLSFVLSGHNEVDMQLPSLLSKIRVMMVPHALNAHLCNRNSGNCQLMDCSFNISLVRTGCLSKEKSAFNSS